LNTAPLVSIMTPVYNAEAFLREAIESVLAQTYPAWELIIVDDGSTDGSRALAESYADPRICVLHQPNSGEAVARNTALANMHGDLLAFVDADDRFLPDHLSLVVAFLNDHPELDGVYTDGYHIDPRGRRLQTLSSRRRGPFTGDLFEQLVRASDVFGPPMCVVLRRSKVVAGRYDFDPAIVIGPDWDFFTRFSQQAQFGYLPECTCEYRIHLTNITVRTGLERRRGYLARCREKAIALDRFSTCSLETRVAVFYDLLVEILFDQPLRQNEVLAWPQFTSLPDIDRARLLKLMASEAALRDAYSPHVAGWLAQAVQLSQGSLSPRGLALLHRLHPRLLQTVLRLRRKGRLRDHNQAPFADIHLADN